MIKESINFKEAGKFEETRFEKIHNVIFDSSKEASILVAQEIANIIQRKEELNEPCVLGLATGSSPIKVYEELVRLHKEEGLSFANVVTFNLDEYYPMDKNDIQSYWYFMHEHLFNHVNIPPQNINIPDGSISNEDLQQYCIDYEMKIKAYGGLDFQLLGIGRTGHIGFNEPGSHVNSGTRSITLDHLTRVDAASSFLGIDNVPRKAITMGIGTVKNAKRIVLLGWGISKADIIKKTIEGEISSRVPATYLQQHNNTTFVLDTEASSELTRVKTPWLVKSVIWTDELKLKAVAWLSELTKKPFLKLTDKDYNDNGMSSVLTEEGTAYNLNIKMFNKMQQTITGWPGGKPNADDTYRPERATPERKRIIIFSPHPDDDVISMGGTFDRLVEQGHDVHIAYQTSGNIAVSNQEALKFAEITKALNADSVTAETIIDFLKNKKSNDIDSLEVRKLKGLIRRSESLAATRYLGLPDSNVNFLDLPFYETGTVKKNNLGEADIEIMCDIIERIKPHQIYAAGDLADPHGTHKVCLDSLFEALKRLKHKSFMDDCWVWLYRGAWHEWETYQIEMAVPMSPDQVLKKRHAIFYHQSQKDGVMFQGDDSREFWIRAEDRNRLTAEKYHALGLADYSAIEAFKRYFF
ncbi:MULTISPECIES: glucosamine-6-phosphate deaminase [Flavobacterium]|jgi:glucosamine-6-phosphate deaminase|uniref:Glucosamine-6-phosphate deaminase n=1 Tax=Flavobacterium johnsoniae (strain ATCC 17061 / DSM 2064 / JCM 8514 / BCRC 14874 / CCUG 350202 / NBRC 14942 / NCIMB 11054 / UW101) TaxID=376686 RepID=A5FIA8_FLAJ1|nr:MULTISPECIES: glucosamine-6-phosphate deaminase [Flavobacterium]ABQ05060.1 glucosamine-6-phosphate isomerase [Flavobacterium johnsoniae UW101]OXG00365.1 glucosamine-6-phosphate deaminase [Flavobacterium johnsoniae UW101]WDF60773.1 glucosamine-6-phosphate deaminase [Flavobacterium sp. KACC 22758]WQG83140.1 glucosamine-6-phosphate deaminase [Flavobacterium johnsoniae UW101]SHL90361.1 glucosamine-6-phosphate deaminase [Flavobacterium johnsoniae]